MANQSNKTKLHHIDATISDFYNPVLDLLDDTEFSKTFLNIDSASDVAEQFATQPQFSEEYRSGLANHIIEQYHKSLISLESDSPVLRNIEKLKEKSTLTVTTGQQIHIFLGPFFVVNKILSCCAEAKEYDRTLSHHDVVPIFWMASEDHDFDEIKSTRLYNEIYEWDIESHGPVGRLNPKSILPLVADAKSRIDQTSENIAFLEVCEFAYANCDTFADATRHIIHRYFENTGLIVVDPDTNFFKSQFSETVQADLFTHEPTQAIKQSIARMKDFGLKAPINTRPINTFYIADSSRNRIEQLGDESFHLVGKEKAFTKEEMEAELRLFPERFSPNALLRPVYQQTILPNIHYVCGASEILYWLELKDVMEEQTLVYPKLSIRKSMFFLSDKNIQKVDKATYRLSDLFLSKENLSKKLNNEQSKELFELSQQIIAFEHQIGKVLTMLDALKSSHSQKTQKSANQLISDIKRQEGEINDSLTELNPELTKLLKIKSNLFDSAYVQERNKFIISMLEETLTALESFNSDFRNFLNYKIITIASA
jgi:bacillithiol synthase